MKTQKSMATGNEKLRLTMFMYTFNVLLKLFFILFFIKMNEARINAAEKPDKNLIFDCTNYSRQDMFSSSLLEIYLGAMEADNQPLIYFINAFEDLYQKKSKSDFSLKANKMPNVLFKIEAQNDLLQQKLNFRIINKEASLLTGLVFIISLSNQLEFSLTANNQILIKKGKGYETGDKFPWEK